MICSYTPKMGKTVNKNTETSAPMMGITTVKINPGKYAVLWVSFIAFNVVHTKPLWGNESKPAAEKFATRCSADGSAPMAKN